MPLVSELVTKRFRSSPQLITKSVDQNSAVQPRTTARDPIWSQARSSHETWSLARRASLGLLSSPVDPNPGPGLYSLLLN